jgi:hypothetical protein
LADPRVGGADEKYVVAGETIGEHRVGQQGAEPRVVTHERESLVRIIGVERDVRGAGLDHGE